MDMITLKDVCPDCTPWDKFSQENVDELETMLESTMRILRIVEKIEKELTPEPVRFVWSNDASTINVPYYFDKTVTLNMLASVSKNSSDVIRTCACEKCRLYTTIEERDEFNGRCQRIDKYADTTEGKFIIRLVQEGVITCQDDLDVIRRLMEKGCRVITTNEVEGITNELEKVKEFAKQLRTANNG